MTLQASGAITLQEINAEFGLGTNLNAYRGQTYWRDDGTSGTFPSGAISMSDFYSTRLTEPKGFSYLGGVANGGSISFGAESPSRLIVVAICATLNTSITVTGVTIGGVSGSIAAQVTKGGNSINPTSAIVYALVPTGASGTVSVNFSSGQSTLVMLVYRVVGCSQTPSDTAIDASGSDLLNLDIPSGTGFAVAASTQVSGASQSWTGLTQRYEIGANSTVHDVADSNGFLSQQANRAISATGGNSTNGNSVSAVWG